jgi:hypothetical protein
MGQPDEADTLEGLRIYTIIIREQVNNYCER